jgi:adenylate kinase family enzyme
MRRVSVVGNSASGKTLVARAICDRLGLPCPELDADQRLDGASRQRDPSGTSSSGP